MNLLLYFFKSITLQFDSESFKFRKCVQKDSESISDYVSRLRKCASTCGYSTSLDRALTEQFTVGLRSKETQLKLLSKEHSLVESIQQAIANEAAVRESANIIPSSTATRSLNFVKHHPPSKKDMKTDKQKHTANFKFHVNLKSSANSKSL